MRNQFRLLAGFFVLFGAAACSDGPTDPSPRVPGGAKAEAVTITTQSGTVGTAVADAPAVVVKDASGKGLAGVAVRFTVSAGGGSVQNSLVETDESGFASSGRWTLGSTAGMNAVDAQASGLSPIRFVANGAKAVANTSAFDITIRYAATATPRQQQAVSAAVARWRTVITQDLYNVPMNVAAGSCFDAQPAVNETVDDLMIFVEFVNIDGNGKTLGEAGPCYIRSDNGLPILGFLRLDASDLALMETYGTLDDVVLHEMGHILGIGTLWPDKELLIGAGSADPQFTGTNGITAYRGMGGTLSYVPVENEGSTGTRDGHWRESVFGNELMSGWISGAPNPMSALTIGSLQDLGYGANPGAASSYTLGGVSSHVEAGVPRVSLHGKEKLSRPRFKVDKGGRKTKIGTQSSP